LGGVVEDVQADEAADKLAAIGPLRFRLCFRGFPRHAFRSEKHLPLERRLSSSAIDACLTVKQAIGFRY
jgi:hypothetical protein